MHLIAMGTIIYDVVVRGFVTEPKCETSRKYIWLKNVVLKKPEVAAVMRQRVYVGARVHVRTLR